MTEQATSTEHLIGSFAPETPILFAGLKVNSNAEATAFADVPAAVPPPNLMSLCPRLVLQLNHQYHLHQSLLG